MDDPLNHGSSRSVSAINTALASRRVQPMFGSSTVWRVTFQTLRQDFQKAAEEYSSLRHVVLQALDGQKTVPPSLQREIDRAGGCTPGELRARWDVPPRTMEEQDTESTQASYHEWLQLRNPAKVGYLIGSTAARKRFQHLAERAWLAVPGTAGGKGQAYPQPHAVDRWLAFVYAKLRDAPASYLAADEELWVAEPAKGGRCREHRFPPREVKEGSIVSTGYPDADGLSEQAKRWIFTALATDPFTASAVAIDVLLAHPDPEGPYLVSWQEMDAYQESPAFQKANFLVDLIALGEGRTFPIYRYWCRPAPGGIASICPNADPPADEADRRALAEYLPAIAQRFRQLHLIEKGQTIHWVGRQTKLGTVCRCDLTRGPEVRTRSSSLVLTARNGLDNVPRVVLHGRDQGPFVLSKPKRKLTTPQFNVVQALLDAGDAGLTKDELVSKSGHEDARGILKRLADSDPDWKEVIHRAGQTGGRYRIK